MRSPTLLLALALGACVPPSTPPLAEPVATEAASIPATTPDPRTEQSLPEPLVCPAVDFAALERAPPEPDDRTVALAQVFLAAEVRPAGAHAKVPRFDLKTVRVLRQGRGPGHDSVGGMGWMGLDRAWVDSTIGPLVREPFEAWISARREWFDNQRAGYLLFVRARYVQSVSPQAAWGEVRCTEQAASQAEQRTAEAEEKTKRTADKLRDALEALDSRSPGETLLLAYLLEDEVPYPRDSAMADVVRPLEMFTALANDPTIDRELRARAAELVARVQPSSRDEAFKSALQRALRLTRDPELRVETWVKLAEIEASPREAEKLHTKIIDHLEVHGEGWRLAQTLGERAQERLDRRAFALALEDAARCANKVDTAFHNDPDPWGCAAVMAESLAELGGAPKDTRVPLLFLGPLALASMHSALDRLDHNQARRAGKLVLELLPETAEAPQVLSMLVDLAQTDDERATLMKRRVRDYGPEGRWTQVHRVRLAWRHDPETLDKRLATLREQPCRARADFPKTAQDFQRQLTIRAMSVGDMCLAPRSPKGQQVRVRVDTTGPTPAASIWPGGTATSRCVRRQVKADFRSVGPAKIDFVLRVVE